MAKNQAKKKQPAIQEKPAQRKASTKHTIESKSKTNFKLYGALALVVLVTLIIFWPSLSLEFVNWDDPQNLLENENLTIFAYQWDWNAVKNIFKSDVMGNYNPLPIFTFAIEKYFFARNPEANPFIFHFNNLWMHLVCTALVFTLFKLNTCILLLLLVVISDGVLFLPILICASPFALSGE